MGSATQVERYPLQRKSDRKGGEVLKKGELEDTFSQGLHFLHEQEAGSPLRVNVAGVG